MLYKDFQESAASFLILFYLKSEQIVLETSKSPAMPTVQIQAHTHTYTDTHVCTEPVFVMQMQLCFGSGSLGFLFALLQLADEPHHNEQQLPRPSRQFKQHTHTLAHTRWWQRQEIVNKSKPRCLRVISPFALGVVASVVARTSCCRCVISMPHTLLSLLYVCVCVCGCLLICPVAFKFKARVKLRLAVKLKCDCDTWFMSFAAADTKLADLSFHLP